MRTFARSRVHSARNLLTICRDIVYITFGKYGQYIITLATLPFIARVLGIHGTGHLAIGMGAYFIGSVVVDLGITSFLAAKVVDSDINQLRGNYIAVRLSILGTLGAALLFSLVVDAPITLQLVLLGLFSGGFSATSEDWLLIGHGRFGASITYDTAGRVVYLGLLLLLLPRLPSAQTALMCLLLSSIVTVGLTWADSFNRYGPPKWPRRTLPLLRIGAPVLASRLLTTVYSYGAPAMYAGALSAASLGLYSASDRLVRAVQSLLDPFGYALLPRMARKSDSKGFWRTAWLALAICLLAAGTAAGLVWLAAPILIPAIFGRDFTEAVSLIRVEIIIIPATALTSFVTTAILPVRQDTLGILIGAIIGTSIAVCALYVAGRTHSVWVLVYGTIASEYAVASWYTIRASQFIYRDRVMRSDSDVEPVPDKAHQS